MAPRLPERYGPYRLMKPIGRGQICEVWEVEHTGNNQRMAIKLIPAGKHHTKENIASLRHEYQIGRQLTHPNIVSTHEFQTGAGGSYIIQDLFRSANMKDLIRQGVDQYVPRIDRMIREAAAGLSYIHGQGWIHRDVKPDNFLIDDEGGVRLIDFNIAQRKPGWLGRMLPGKSKVQGTQSYMSPEQIRGETTDEQSDIYSFGCTIHELVAGKPPFTGTTTNELLNKHLRSKAPPVTIAAENARPEFARLLLTLIEKEPALRPASVAAFLEDLGDIKVFK